MKTTVYKMQGMAYDFLAAVDADGGRIYVLVDKNENPPIRDLKREDVTDCSSWDVYDLRELMDTDTGDCTWDDTALDKWMHRSGDEPPKYATFDDMIYAVVFQHGTAEIVEKWDDMDI